jgi:hypothetical protein
MKESTEYEIQKAKHKRLLVRNEFRGVGKYDIPLMRKQRIDLDKIKFLDYTKAKINDGENAHKTVHFFMHDWKFDKVSTNPTANDARLYVHLEGRNSLSRLHDRDQARGVTAPAK